MPGSGRRLKLPGATTALAMLANAMDGTALKRQFEKQSQNVQQMLDQAVWTE